jgi:hypothetical protein
MIGMGASASAGCAAWLPSPRADQPSAPEYRQDRSFAGIVITLVGGPQAPQTNVIMVRDLYHFMITSIVSVDSTKST